MKNIKFLVLFIFVFGLFQGNLGNVVAQDTCPTETATDWWNRALPEFVRYTDVVEATPYEIATIANLQEMRRRLEDEELVSIRPACADNLHEELIRMLNAGSDAVVASLLPNPELAEELFSIANSSNETLTNVLIPQFEQEIGLTDNPRPTATIVSLTSLDGRETFATDQPIGQRIRLNGTFIPNTFEEGDQLWLFVSAPDFLYYPQFVEICTDNERSVDMNNARGTWSSFATFGRDVDTGAIFELSLQYASESTSAALNELIATSCENGEGFGGLTLAEVQDMGFVELDFISNIERE